jgi:hypothetical protein
MEIFRKSMLTCKREVPWSNLSPSNLPREQLLPISTKPKISIFWVYPKSELSILLKLDSDSHTPMSKRDQIRRRAKMKDLNWSKLVLLRLELLKVLGSKLT